MAIKKAQSNLDNGTTYDVLHHETQASQVQVLNSSGVPISELDEMLISGKLMNAPDLNTVKASGKYRIKGGTNLPAGMVLTNTYILNVDSVDVGSGVIVAHQKFYDHVNHEVYHRTINGATIGLWIKIGKSMVDQVAKIGTLTSLNTTQKTTLVNSINEVFQLSNDHTNALNDLASELTMQSFHNHDAKYVPFTGGSLTGDLSVPNNKSFLGKNTSGTNVSVVKVDASNNVVLGSTGNKGVIQATGHDISVSNGTTSHKIFHAGNDGSGSGLDADKVDGIDGSQIARLDINNYYQGDQFVDNGKSIVVRGVTGSEQAGSIYFRNGANEQKAKIGVQTDGDITVTAGTVNGHIFRSTGELYSSYNHLMDVSTREVRLNWKNGSTDAGVGFYMNNNTNQVGLWDWASGKQIFSTDRSDGTISFNRAPDIQGHKLSIQTSTPSNPDIGDVWIDI